MAAPVTMSARALLRCAAPALLLATLVLVPFFNKPFSIDDVTFLLEAQQMRVDPLHPTAFTMVFHGEPTRVSTKLVSGPVMPILLLPSVLDHGAEWLAHLVQLIVLLLGVLAVVALALRLGLPPGAATLAGLLTVASPAVLGMASTAMADVPSMTFGALGMERLLAWRQTRRRGVGVAAGVAFALAVQSRPHLLLLLGPAAILLFSREEPGVAERPERGLRALVSTGWPLLLTLALLAATNWITRDPLGSQSIAVATVHRFNQLRTLRNLGNLGAQWVVGLPLGLLWLAVEGRNMLRSLPTLAALVVGVLLARRTEDWHWMWWIAPVTALGTAVVVHVLAQALRRRDWTELALGLWLIIAAPAMFYDHLPSKYLVPSAPAMALLLAPRLTRRPRLRPLVAGLLAAEVVVALLVIRADAALAEIGRRGAAEFIAPEVGKGERVWSDGAWGYQWYAMQAGARPMTVGPPHPAPGDLVVVGLQGGNVAYCPKRRLLRQWIVAGPGGRVLSDGAGFFTNTTGTLPWSWGSGELGRVEVWRIE